MSSTIQSAFRRFFGRQWKKFGVLVIILIACFEVLSRSLYSSSWSTAIWQNYVFSLGASEVIGPNNAASNGTTDAEQNLFPAKNITGSDGIRTRLISQLKTMNEYGTTSLTVSRTIKVCVVDLTDLSSCRYYCFSDFVINVMRKHGLIEVATSQICKLGLGCDVCRRQQ
jgi:hypothetical protein